MRVEILSIGDEILIGQIVNTNAAFIAEKLTELGYDVDWITTVGDDAERIENALKLAESRVDVVVATGGLGPTHDDITKKVFAKYFNSKLILNEQVLHKIKERFRRRRIRMAKINNEQAMVPDNATVIENHAGTAPGLLFQKEAKYFIVMPGVPAEMSDMMETSIIPYLKNKTNKIYKKRVIHTAGIAESTLFEQLGKIEELEKLTKIAFLPTYSGVNIRLSAQGETEEYCQERINQVEKIFQEKYAQYIWGYDDEALEQVVAQLLIRQNRTLSIVEFGTHGNISSSITSVPDANKYFIQGFTLGSEDRVVKFLSLNDTVNKTNIVNEIICQVLANKIRQITDSDLAMAVMHDSGLEITTHITLCDDQQTISQRYIFTFHPSMNIQRIAAAALRLLHQHLIQQKIS